MTVPYFYKNDNSRFLSVEGEDSTDFLQNLITNDINKCTKRKYYIFLLAYTSRKIYADFFIFKKEKIYNRNTLFFYEKLLKN